jgi:uncharacterized protein YebE (UPF0316 family)
MFIIIRLRRYILIPFLFLAIFCVLLIFARHEDELFSWETVPVNSELTEEYTPVVEEIITLRNQAMLAKDFSMIEPLYNTKTTYGIWAYEHEVKKIKYLHNWADKQGVTFKDISTFFKVRWVKEKNGKMTVNFSAITEYIYEYENSPDVLNSMRIATYHVLDLSAGLEDYVITREWYTDPFADSLNLDNIKTEDNKAFIMTQEKRDFSNLNERRLGAVEYAKLYCGASDNEDYFFLYNKQYKNYNGSGGDCANFASQVLHEGGKFRKTSGWNYEKDGNRAWVNAQGFKDYLIYSGRGSLIIHGTYDKVLKLSYKLLPGDIIAYEKKGKVAHISVVTGADSRGYALVSCHNTDRFMVPWDLGWSDKGIKFWLIRVNY